MANRFINNYDETTLLYAAVSIFIFAVLFEFWRRFIAIQKRNAENPLSERMEKALHYFAENKRRIKITNDIYQKLTGISDATATRDLDKLEELGFFEQKGKNRGVYYRTTQKAKKHIKSHKRTAH